MSRRDDVCIPREMFPDTKERRKEINTLYGQYGYLRVQEAESLVLSVGRIALDSEWLLVEDTIDALETIEREKRFAPAPFKPRRLEYDPNAPVWEVHKVPAITPDELFGKRFKLVKRIKRPVEKRRSRRR